MGQNDSKENRIYENHSRIYTKWDHRGAMASDDIVIVAQQRLQNSSPDENQSKSLPTMNKSIQQTKTKSHSRESSQINSERPTNHLQSRLPIERDQSKIPLGIRKSQSMETFQMKATKTVITAEQLIAKQTKRRQQRISSPNLSLRNIEQPPSSTTIPTSKSTNQQKKDLPKNLQFVLIDSNDIKNAKEIGKGNFGTVYHAIYKGTRDVALKTLHSDNDENQSIRDYDQHIYELLHEAHIMMELKHPNLLTIIGLTSFGEKQNLSLVTDFMKKGSLLNYLRDHRDNFIKSNQRTINKKLNSFARQIFEAMLYLEQRNIIHRDLAARNCLIGQDDQLKVGDFGLTTLTDCGLYKGTYRSICAPRWTSPEAVLFSKYSSRSDVWSYGITLWELYSLGDRPFGHLNNFAFNNLLKNPVENISRHVVRPQYFGSEETYTHLILPCLTYNVTLRPRFRDLKERVFLILNDRIEFQQK